VNTGNQLRERLRLLYASQPQGSQFGGGELEHAIRKTVFIHHLYGDVRGEPSDHTQLVEDTLREALETLPAQDSDQYIWWLVCVARTFGFSQSAAPLMIQLLLRLGHDTHEELVDQLERLRLPLAIPAFVFAAKHRKHLVNSEYGDDGDAMARKAVWALGKLRRTDTNSAEAEAALCELAELKDRKVARYATSMLKRGEC
jgi:hypothetical protein